MIKCLTNAFQLRSAGGVVPLNHFHTTSRGSSYQSKTLEANFIGPTFKGCDILSCFKRTNILVYLYLAADFSSFLGLVNTNLRCNKTELTELVYD